MQPEGFEQHEAAGLLQQRVERALGWHDVSNEYRDMILDGVSAAGGLGYVGWDQLPKATQDAIVEVESLPQTGWADPADVPDGAGDDF